MPGADLLLWTPWALLLSALAGWVGVRAYRRGDRAGAVGWAGWALLPPALLLTGVVRLAGRVTGAFVDWSLALVFTSTTWVGVALGGIAAGLLATGRVLRSRRPPPLPRSGARAGPRSGPRSGPAATEVDEAHDIEEILRRRGIR